MPDRSRKRPTDANKLAKRIVDIASDEPIEAEKPKGQGQEKDPAAVALGRRGGLKGGKARAQSLSPEKRAEIARKAADARWKAKD